MKIRDILSLGSNKWAQAPKEAPFRRFDGHRPTIEKPFSYLSNSLWKGCSAKFAVKLSEKSHERAKRLTITRVIAT